ncbi:Ribosomal RNA large subunit methyltransferase F [Labeo rohita]|uniref:Ribosomal RNA large subunit methyltransferase F n=1 Tax=Labeo rohita TaxID=84645 RepID=A0ABQ8MGT3_LABRO|nr:Ribosomal RNA large subunit methyltransferase F [Labeo rohita]
MGKTADLTVVQKTIIDTLHKEDDVRGILPELRRRRNGLLPSAQSKVLFADESKFCISFGNQGPRVWRKGGEA